MAPGLTGSLTTILDLTPTASALLLTVGLGAIAWEFNRPGRVLPGTTGLLTMLLTSAHLYRLHVSPWAVLLWSLSLACVLLPVWRPLPVWCAVPATFGLIAGWRLLLPPEAPARVDLWVSAVCGTVTGGGAWWLTGVAGRARRAKALD